MDCVAYLEQYKKFKATVERSFVTLEKLILESGLNKIDCLEMLELIPRVSPDPDAVREIVKPVRRLWKSVGRPRKDGTPAQPRFFKIKPKTPPVYDSDSYKSKSSDDENYCRRSDNEEWNPDKKNLSLYKREKKYKTKHNSGGKRGRPKKSLDDKPQVLNERKLEQKIKPHNGILTKTEHFNGNNAKIFVKRPRGRPPKSSEATEKTLDDQRIATSVKKKVLQKSYFNDSNISSNDERELVVSKKGRGRPKKDALATAMKLVVNKKMKKRTKATKKPTIKSIKRKKRGRPPKNADLIAGVNEKTADNESSRKRKRNQMEKSIEWATETEEEVKVETEVIESDTDATIGDLESTPQNYKSFIFAS